ncbi:MAG TPA: hypothetical protein VKA46_05985 [Gemmataceae bacterium]|nr:hypothetical protein [Gemmataceae bacterium]
MDQIELVTEQIDDGRRLIERLIQEGISVTAAGWLTTSDDEGQWCLYVASPIRDESPLKAYKRVQAVIRRMPHPFWIGLLDVKVISPTSPIAQRMLSIYRRYPAKNGIRYTHRLADGEDVGIEEAFIYPPPIMVPSSQGGGDRET